VGDVVRSGASGARIFDAQFFVLVWPDAIFKKSTMGHVMLYLCFYIRWDLRVM
jgi:hypothetical protein